MGNCLECSVLSASSFSFKNDKGETREMTKVYISTDSGEVGCIYSSKRYEAGDIVSVGLRVGKDGKFAARIMD